MALYFLYFVEVVSCLGFAALIIGALIKAINAPQKAITYINEYGNPRVRWVDDTAYKYKPEELWEPPAYWNFEKVTQPEINHFGDDDWPHTEQHT
jgi:hypothetical protein